MAIDFAQEAEELGALREAEHAFLRREQEKHPELFITNTFIDDSEMLGELGIWISGKELLPLGALKVWPEDFIVEEIIHTGISTVALEETPQVLQKGTDMAYATLVKCNLSTLQAVEELSRKLNIPMEHIGYAGLKDKDAITAQRISIYGVSLAQIKTIRSPFFFLKDFECGESNEHNFRKGMLIANRFTIIVRVPPAFFTPEHSQVFAQRIQHISEEGFYNFFYLQRFSTPRLRNFVWARLLLQGKHRQAMMDFLTEEGKRELPYFRRLRRQLRSSFGDWQETAKLIAPFPLMFRHERKIVDHLIRHPDDYAGAFQTAPDQITIWVYALASLLFNQKISDHLIAGEEPPSELPFFLSRNKKDIEIYRDMLERLGLYPFPYSALRHFPQIKLTPRRTATKSTVLLRRAEIIDDGLVIEFDLAKGQYATTFLSHFFNLIHGAVPSSISTTRLDSKQLLGEAPLASILERFEGVIEKEAFGFQRAVGES